MPRNWWDQHIKAHDGRSMLSPAAARLMLVRRSKSQLARNRICAIPVETAQLCKAANRAATYLLCSVREVRRAKP
jgi:hypothetical protein